MKFMTHRTNSSLSPSSVHARGFVHPPNFFPFPISSSLKITVWSESPRSTFVGPSDSAYWSNDDSLNLFSWIPSSEIYTTTVSSSWPSSTHPRGFVHPLNFFPFLISFSLPRILWSCSPRSGATAHYTKFFHDGFFSTDLTF